MQVCALSPRERVSESLALTYAEVPGRPLPDAMTQPGLSYDEVLHDDFRFDLDAHDVMVFLHIQKTGGTSFGKHLVMDLDLKVCISLMGISLLEKRLLTLQGKVIYLPVKTCFLDCLQYEGGCTLPRLKPKAYTYKSR